MSPYSGSGISFIQHACSKFFYSFPPAEMQTWKAPRFYQENDKNVLMNHSEQSFSTDLDLWPGTITGERNTLLYSLSPWTNDHPCSSKIVVAQGLSCPVACGIFLAWNWTHVSFIGRQILNSWTPGKTVNLLLFLRKASQAVLVVKKPPAIAGDIWDAGLIPGLGRSSGEGHGNPLQYSCLENPMDRGVWWAIQSMGLQRVRHDWSDLVHRGVKALPLSRIDILFLLSV